MNFSYPADCKGGSTRMVSLTEKNSVFYDSPKIIHQIWCQKAKTSPHWALSLLSFFTLYEVLPTFGHLWIAPFSLGSLARAILGSCRIS